MTQEIEYGDIKLKILLIRLSSSRQNQVHGTYKQKEKELLHFSYYVAPLNWGYIFQHRKNRIHCRNCFVPVTRELGRESEGQTYYPAGLGAQVMQTLISQQSVTWTPPVKRHLEQARSLFNNNIHQFSPLFCLEAKDHKVLSYMCGVGVHKYIWIPLGEVIGFTFMLLYVWIKMFTNS